MTIVKPVQTYMFFMPFLRTCKTNAQQFVLFVQTRQFVPFYYDLPDTTLGVPHFFSHSLPSPCV